MFAANAVLFARIFIIGLVAFEQNAKDDKAERSIRAFTNLVIRMLLFAELFAEKMSTALTSLQVFFGFTGLDQG